MAVVEREISDLLEPILWAYRDRLEAIIGSHAVTAYLEGTAQMMEYGRTLTTDMPIYYEGPPVQDAINYANKHAAQLVTKIDQETKERLAKVIGDAIENKRGIPGLSRDIRKEFDDMSKYRSQMIARTETADSLSQGSLDRMKDMGITGKEWVRGGSDECDICQGNEDAGVIAVDKSFPSGHTRTPGHPQCLCTTAPAML